MQAIFIPLCLDVTTLHKYMKTNYQIEEKNRLGMLSAFDENDIPLAGSIISPPMFHSQSPYQLIHWQKESIYHSWGNGVSSHGSRGFTVIILPDGYSITEFQLNTIAQYAKSLPAPALI